MTAILSHNALHSDLLHRRRANNSNTAAMVQLMADYSMSNKSAPDTMAMSGPQLHLQFLHDQPHGSNMDTIGLGGHGNAFSAAGLAPSTMAFSSNALAADSISFTNPYNLATTFPASVPTIPQLDTSNCWSNYGAMQMGSMPSAHMRSDSLSSFESCPPLIKSEDDGSPVQSSQAFYNRPSCSPQHERSSPTSSEDSGSPSFSTDVDTLMKAIQSKGTQSEAPEIPKPSQPSSLGISTPSKPKKRYQCPMSDCNKCFYQKTHLEIHTRAHTGLKPFLCKEPTCGQRFSQLGNLKTHERRHTGERPYSCDICGKTFAQRGNVRAHKIVHTAAKPFTCKLDSCNKQFTQLGNLKSHQNKFHAETIRNLKRRFETMREGDVVSSWEKEMWEYFGSLYKNCNKGIKGRGKDRRISNTGFGMQLEVMPKLESDSRRGSYSSTSSLASEYCQPMPMNAMKDTVGLQMAPGFAPPYIVS